MSDKSELVHSVSVLLELVREYKSENDKLVDENKKLLVKYQGFDAVNTRCKDLEIAYSNLKLDYDRLKRGV